MHGNCYNAEGIVLNPSVPLSGTTVTISYSGILAKNGATSLFAHIGYGNRWEHVGDFPMKKTDTGFLVNVPVPYAPSLNICFKDGADNWDNNNGKNYTFDVDC